LSAGRSSVRCRYGRASCLPVQRNRTWRKRPINEHATSWTNCKFIVSPPQRLSRPGRERSDPVRTLLQTGGVRLDPRQPDAECRTLPAKDSLWPVASGMPLRQRPRLVAFLVRQRSHVGISLAGPCTAASGFYLSSGLRVRTGAVAPERRGGGWKRPTTCVTSPGAPVPLLPGDHGCQLCDHSAHGGHGHRQIFNPAINRSCWCQG